MPVQHTSGLITALFWGEIWKWECLAPRHNSAESTQEPKHNGAAAAKQTGRFSLLEKSVKDTAHTSSYTTDLEYVTLEMKSTVARQTIVGCWILKDNENRLIGKAGSDKTDISRSGP